MARVTRTWTKKRHICTACGGTGRYWHNLWERLHRQWSICGKCWGKGYIER